MVKTGIKSNLKDIETQIKFLLEDKLPGNIYFHNYDHTLVMKKEVKRLAKASGLSKDKQEQLLLAALFYNTGFTGVYDKSHEKRQVIAVEYLSGAGYSKEEINKILVLMNVLHSDEPPGDLKEKIFHDAYYSYYGLKRYKQKTERLREEMEENIEGYLPTDAEWEKDQLDKTLKHHFYTQAAIKRYSDRKKLNLAKSKKRISQLAKKEIKALEKFSIADNKAAITMFKTSLRNHIDLTSIADQKSNMMLSINALLLTIGIPIFASYLADKLYLLAPAVIFLITCVTTMIFATLSTRPIKMNGDTNLERLHSGKTNLFFFGNFYNIGLEPYTKAIKKVISNKEQLDSSIINDLYYLGHSLGNKFRYLRTCYNVFIIGICISILAFIVSYLLSN